LKFHHCWPTSGKILSATPGKIHYWSPLEKVLPTPTNTTPLNVSLTEKQLRPKPLHKAVTFRVEMKSSTLPGVPIKMSTPASILRSCSAAGTPPTTRTSLIVGLVSCFFSAVMMLAVCSASSRDGSMTIA